MEFIINTNKIEKKYRFWYIYIKYLLFNVYVIKKSLKNKVRSKKKKKLKLALLEFKFTSNIYSSILLYLIKAIIKLYL